MRQPSESLCACAPSPGALTDTNIVALLEPLPGAARRPDRSDRARHHREPLGTRHLLERGKPKGAAGRIALPVAGDDKRFKDVVIRLLDQLGFDGVDAGGLDESWRRQPATPV